MYYTQRIGSRPSSDLLVFSGRTRYGCREAIIILAIAMEINGRSPHRPAVPDRTVRSSEKWDTVGCEVSIGLLTTVPCYLWYLLRSSAYTLCGTLC